MRCFTIGAVGLLVCAFTNAQAPAAKGATSGAARRLDVNALATDSINTKLVGMPLLPTINRLARASALTKGQFETTAAFQSRRETAAGFADFQSGGPLVFTTSVEQSGGLSYSYDADGGVLNLIVRPGQSVLSTSDIYGQLTTLVLDNVSMKADLYRAQNAFGAHADVSKVGSTLYGVAFVLPLPFVTMHPHQDALPFASIKMSPTQAAREIPKLRAALAMELVAPGVAMRSRRKSPTVDAPIDETTDEKYVFGNFQGVVFYSGITGQVFARAPEGFAKASPTEVPSAQTAGSP